MKKKLLIITHDIGIFGASRSLQFLTNNLTDFQIDMIVPKQLYAFKRMYQNKMFFSKKNEDSIRKDFGPNINNIFYCMLNMDFWCNVISNYMSKKRNIYALIEFFIKYYDKRQIKKILKTNNYDYVYLNSSILHNYINLKQNETFIIHIREDIITPNPHKFQINYKKFDGAIFIDYATFNSIKNAQVINTEIIMNPFDMTDLYKYNKPQLPIDENKTIYAMFGALKDIKGTKFVIKAFIKAKLTNSILLLVGDGDNNYIKECKDLSNNDKNIIFIPATKDIKSYYLIIDYIIRGEPYLALGRTIYEALYSSCNVIVPSIGEEELNTTFFEYDKFKHKIYYFEPNNIKSLSQIFKNTKKTNNQKILLSNVKQHTNKIKTFLQSCKIKSY